MRRADQLAPVRTDVATEIEEIVSGFEPLARSQGVRLTTQFEAGFVADVDRGALRQVLLNLLDNAVRYGPPGQNVTITTTSAGDSWTLEVADEGPGIPADERRAHLRAVLPDEAGCWWCGWRDGHRARRRSPACGGAWRPSARGCGNR